MKSAVIAVVYLMLVSAASADVKQEITKMLQDQDSAWNRGDLDAFVSHYEDSGELVFISTVVIRSPQELKERYQKRYKSSGKGFGQLHFSELQVQELAPGLARAWGKWTVKEDQKTSTGWFTLILKKSDKGWKIIHDHSS